jgi:hypothetical protein
MVKHCLRVTALSMTVLFGGVSGAMVASASVDTGSYAAGKSRSQIAQAMRLIPMAFEANEGQFESDVRFIARGLGYGAVLRDSGATLRLTRFGGNEARSASIDVRFAGANPNVRPVGRDETLHKTNYLIGSDPARFRTGITSYRTVEYEELYPGIDLVYYGNQTKLEYDLIVRPGGDPSAIRLEYQGAKPTIDRNGDLILRTAAGELKQLRPVAYQDVDGARKNVSVRYVASGRNSVGIRVARYDATRTLVIDPVLSYSTFLGGKASEEGVAIAVDETGNAYVAGQTESGDFPTTGGAFDSSLSRNERDAFIVKLNPTATALVFATYLGGSAGYDEAKGVQVDAAGNVYVCGVTGAGPINANNFPTTPGAYQVTTPIGANSGFLSKLSPNGTKLIYSTYLIGTSPNGLAVDIYGQAYVTGRAVSDFSATPGAFQQSGANSAFVAKVNTSGSSLIYGTFIGGTSRDIGKAIAIDAQGNAYVAGLTESSNFPRVLAMKATISGVRDGFVAKVNPTGSALLFSTYIGGSGYDEVHAIAVDGAGSIYLAGHTQSTDFPLVNAFQTSIASGFLAKLNPSGSAFTYSTYLGPINSAVGINAISVDGNGFVTVAGVSYNAFFPLQDPINNSTSGLFVTRFDPSGLSLVYSILVGSATPAITDESTGGPGLFVDTGGNTFVTATTGDPAFPITAGVIDPTLGGTSGDAVVLKLSSKKLAVSIASNTSPAVAGQFVTLSAVAQDGGATLQSGTVSFLRGDLVIGNAPIINGSATLTTTLPVGVLPLRAIYRGGGEGGASQPLYLSVNQAASCN